MACCTGCRAGGQAAFAVPRFHCTSSPPTRTVGVIGDCGALRHQSAEIPRSQAALGAVGGTASHLVLLRRGPDGPRRSPTRSWGTVGAPPGCPFWRDRVATCHRPCTARQRSDPAVCRRARQLRPRALRRARSGSNRRSTLAFLPCTHLGSPVPGLARTRLLIAQFVSDEDHYRCDVVGSTGLVRSADELVHGLRGMGGRRGDP